MCTWRLLWERGEGGTEEFLVKLCNFTLAPILGICLIYNFCFHIFIEINLVIYTLYNTFLFRWNPNREELKFILV